MRGASVGSREGIPVAAGESRGERTQSGHRMKELQFYPVGNGNDPTPWSRDVMLPEQIEG